MVKKKVQKLLTITSLTLGTILFSNVISAQAKSNTIPVQFLGINDFHGALDVISKDPKGRLIGGADYLSSNFNKAEQRFLSTHTTAADKYSIRVQSGDMVGASPAISGLLQDEPTMKILNTMDFKVGTLGNHEFDEGLPEYRRILDGEPTDKFGSIVENYSRVKNNMKIVAANVVNKGTQDIAAGFSPYIVENIGGVKVGFIGIVTTATKNLVLANYIKDYDFLDEVDTVAKYTKILQNKEGVHAIVVLSHLPALSNGSPLTDLGKDATGEAADLIQKVAKKVPNHSIDIVFAGHNHQYTNGVIGKTRIVQSYSNGKAFSNVIGELDPKTGDFIETPSAKIEYNYRDLPPDTAITTITNEAESLTESTLNEIIGYSDAEIISRETNLEGQKIDDKESPLGNLITDAQRFMAKKSGLKVDFAMTNNGGIRADLTTRLVGGKHAITWGSAQAVQPFGNVLQIVEMKGADIITALNQQYKTPQTYFLQVSGLKYVFTDSNDPRYDYKVSTVTKDDGAPIEPNQMYRVVINDFLLGGGDGFSAFTKGNLVAGFSPDTETFINYIRSENASGRAITARKSARKTYKSQADLTNEAIVAIRSATKIKPLHAGDKMLIGKTLPNALITINKKLPYASKEILKKDFKTQSDQLGAFAADVSRFNLEPGEKLIITITDINHHKATFEVPVLATNQSAGTIKPNLNEKVASSSLTDHKVSPSLIFRSPPPLQSQKTYPKVAPSLPQAGDSQTDFLLVLSGLLIFLAFYFLQKKRA